MSDESEQATEIENLDREVALINHTNRTGERPMSPGCCNDCGADIPQRRLQALPDAVTCITCQAIRENRKRHGLGSC